MLTAEVVRPTPPVRLMKEITRLIWPFFLEFLHGLFRGLF